MIPGRQFAGHGTGALNGFPVARDHAQGDIVVGKLVYVVNDKDYFDLHWSARAEAACRMGLEVHLIAPGSSHGGVPGPPGITLHDHRFRPTNGRSWWHAGKAALEVPSVVGRIAPDIVHCITAPGVVVGGTAARLKQTTALVASFPGLGSAFVGSGVRARVARRGLTQAYRWILRHPNSAAVFENDDDLRELRKRRALRDGQGHVIRGAGVDLDTFHPSSEPNGFITTVLFAGRLIRQKGLEDLVEAVSILRRRGTLVRLQVAGHIDQGNPLAIGSRQIEEWTRAGLIEWLGKRWDMPDVIRDADVVCLPSYYREGVPRILIEGAACGKPLVTTDTPGCRDICKDGVNGRLVRTRDSRHLADALAEIAADPVRRRRMGLASRALAEAEFGNEKVISETLSLYRNLLRG